MTTKKNRNKIHASSEKLTTTKKSNIMKGGTSRIEMRRIAKQLQAEKQQAEKKIAADKKAAEVEVKKAEIAKVDKRLLEAKNNNTTSITALKTAIDREEKGVATSVEVDWNEALVVADHMKVEAEMAAKNAVNHALNAVMNKDEAQSSKKLEEEATIKASYMSRKAEDVRRNRTTWPVNNARILKKTQEEAKKFDTKAKNLVLDKFSTEEKEVIAEDYTHNTHKEVSAQEQLRNKNIIPMYNAMVLDAQAKVQEAQKLVDDAKNKEAEVLRKKKIGLNVARTENEVNALKNATDMWNKAKTELEEIIVVKTYMDKKQKMYQTESKRLKSIALKVRDVAKKITLDKKEVITKWNRFVTDNKISPEDKEIILDSWVEFALQQIKLEPANTELAEPAEEQAEQPPDEAGADVAKAEEAAAKEAAEKAAAEKAAAEKAAAEKAAAAEAAVVVAAVVVAQAPAAEAAAAAAAAADNGSVTAKAEAEATAKAAAEKAAAEKAAAAKAEAAAKAAIDKKMEDLEAKIEEAQHSYANAKTQRLDNSDPTKRVDLAQNEIDAEKALGEAIHKVTVFRIANNYPYKAYVISDKRGAISGTGADNINAIKNAKQQVIHSQVIADNAAARANITRALLVKNGLSAKERQILQGNAITEEKIAAITARKAETAGSNLKALELEKKARDEAKEAKEVKTDEAKSEESELGSGKKNTSIENSAIEKAIGAIILALALTISDSNPRTNTKKGVGAKPFGQRKNISPVTKEEYDKLTTQIAEITKERLEIENKFNEIKTEPGNKKEGLIKILNELLINKQKFAAIKHPKYDEPSGIRPGFNITGGFTGGQGCAYDDPKPDPLCKLAVEFYNSRNRELQEHKRTINEIMSYLLEQKINIRYQWVAITKKISTSSDYTAQDISRTSRRVGIISKLNYDNTREGTAIGPWGFEVWIPDRRGFEILVRPDANGLKKKLKVINDKEEIIDKFKTENISLSYIEFLTDKQYDPTNDVNYKPVIKGEDPEETGSIGKIKGMRQGLNKGLNAVTSISPVTGTYINAERLTKSASARGLREDLKGLIKDVIENKFKDKPKDVELLNTIINFYNKKKSIKDILISKISYIFASGETRLNLFNRKNLAKNFKSDEEEGKEGEDDEKGKTRQEGGANEEADDLEGGGGYGFRNFDKKDAENIIRLILDSLSVLAYEGIPASSRDLLFSTYLKKFLKITPSELNKILQDITRVSALSKNVITHYINRLNGNQEAKEEKEDSPAAQISKLNFALKNNVQAFIGSIVYITLHTEQMVGSKAKIQYYLDNEYNKAMKLPTVEEQTRIDNFHLKKSLDDIFGNENNSIKDYRNKLKTIDSYIDSMNENNIENVLGNFSTVFKLASLEGEKIIYKIPGSIQAIIKEKAEDKKEAKAIEESSKIKLAQAEKLVKELLAKYPESAAVARPTEETGEAGAAGAAGTTGATGATGAPGTGTTGTGSTAETAKHAELRTNLQKLLETLGTRPPSSFSE